MISLAEPLLGEEEKDALSTVIDSGWLTMGEKVETFEKAFAKLHQVDSAVAVNSCTAGLHLSLLALGIGPGDEVLVPSLTFVATVNAILYVGAKPTFVDIESFEIPHISIADAERKRSNRTRAAIVMHYGGYLVDLSAWRSFADKYKISLIEDAAHAPGMKGVGKISDAAVFSFFSNKNMTTAEGGMITSCNSDVLDKVRRQRSHGMTKTTLDRHKGHAYAYDVPTLGYNYRLDEIRAALGLVQLTRVQKWNKKRGDLSGCYRQLLRKDCPMLTLCFAEAHETSGHLFPVLLPEFLDRTNVMADLFNKGIQSSNHYPPVHKFSFYLDLFPDLYLPVTESYCSRELTLPLHPKLEKKDIRKVTTALSELLTNK